eukprot:CAMPEP_0118943710 /NCGR_PEP_ID=MMETSP1169-20130426/38886_1 /TAXON_ID=36882 /ORGANISM="Pyramimonas obovata, Strain CCMP722" /LENGTH=192 /DNA_ID=CAMNT_0006889023 /DNA_START=121 /DNA_END=696 /DNA_ORIENTATION=-
MASRDGNDRHKSTAQAPTARVGTPLHCSLRGAGYTSSGGDASSPDFSSSNLRPTTADARSPIKSPLSSPAGAANGAQPRRTVELDTMLKANAHFSPTQSPQSNAQSPASPPPTQAASGTRLSPRLEVNLSTALQASNAQARNRVLRPDPILIPPFAQTDSPRAGGSPSFSQVRVGESPSASQVSGVHVLDLE